MGRRPTMVGRMHRGWPGPGRGSGRGPGKGGWQQADLPDAEDAAAWLRGRLPDDWFTGAPEVRVDREEILIVGELPPLDEEFSDDDSGRANRAAAIAGRISRFREQTREERIDIARQPERIVLDTLVDAGVARSRSDALAWAVKLVGEHADDWLSELRTAMAKVDELRAHGPTTDGPTTDGPTTS